MRNHKLSRSNDLTLLWYSNDPTRWSNALDRYWEYIRPENVELERRLEGLDLNRIRAMDEMGWYTFLKDEYFRWKYTAPNRYATTTSRLKVYADKDRLEELHKTKEKLLSLDPTDIRRALSAELKICGLGVAGMSGLLSLMYPSWFATVDQFVVKSLRTIKRLPEADSVARMNPNSIKVEDGVILIDVMRRKAQEVRRIDGEKSWTPRMIDKVLWAYRPAPRFSERDAEVR